MKRRKPLLPVIGWREWVALPDLGTPAIKVKVDTGARSSALHAFNLHAFERDGRSMVRFEVHPYQRSATRTEPVELEAAGRRRVRNSGGFLENRWTVFTRVSLAGQVWIIELTLTNRDAMGFRMLLGRQAIRGRFTVDPGRSFLHPGHKPEGETSTRWKQSP